VKKVTDKGIVVVAAAGNLGKRLDGQLQYGGITAPGNAPWVLTVGASTTNGTYSRSDDQMAPYSSSGPTAIDFGAKPDLVAPGTGIISLAAPGSRFWYDKSALLLWGDKNTSNKPYMSLSGTSMAAPVVSGTVALMLQANPNLTPNLVKAILQYTAEVYPGYDTLRQGAGFLNTLGAVQLARYYANVRSGDRMPVQTNWSKKIIWGTQELKHGVIKPDKNAWGNNIVWGVSKTPSGYNTSAQNIVWGVTTSDDNNIVWGVNDSQSWGVNIVWGTNNQQDIIWGTGYARASNIVWGTDCGGEDCANVTWGTVSANNIVWGVCAAGSNILWGTNIVWGVSADSVTVWGEDSVGDDVVFPDDLAEGTSSKKGGLGHKGGF
jgi:hypothetical protein